MARTVRDIDGLATYLDLLERNKRATRKGTGVRGMAKSRASAKRAKEFERIDDEILRYGFPLTRMQRTLGATDEEMPRGATPAHLAAGGGVGMVAEAALSGAASRGVSSIASAMGAGKSALHNLRRGTASYNPGTKEITVSGKAARDAGSMAHERGHWAYDNLLSDEHRATLRHMWDTAGPGSELQNSVARLAGKNRPDDGDLLEWFAEEYAARTAGKGGGLERFESTGLIDDIVDAAVAAESAKGRKPMINVTPSGVGALRLLLEDPKKLSGVPNVPQRALERRIPPKGDPETIGRLYEPGNVRRVKDLTTRGIERGGLAWYNTDPLRVAAMEALGDAEGNRFWRSFMERVAATSPRSTVADNIKRASYFQTRAEQGVPVDLLTQPERPYGHLAHKTHAPMLAEIDETGTLGSLTRPKASSFAENLSGNYAPLTADAHYVRGIALQKKSGKPETGAPSATQYPGVERFGQNIAAELGIAPAQQQASLWMGASDETGVRNAQIFMQALNDAFSRTAAARGVTEKKVLQDFLRGKAPLLSVGGVPLDIGQIAGAFASQQGPAEQRPTGTLLEMIPGQPAKNTRPPRKPPSAASFVRG